MRCWIICTLLLAFVGQQPLRAQETPKEMGLVPADGFALVHVRLAELWQNEAMRELRDIVLEAGPEVLSGFDQRFSPRISSVERMTVLLPEGSFDLRRGPLPIVILVLRKPIDPRAFAESIVKGPRVATPRGELILDRRGGSGYFLADANTLVFGPAETMQKYLAAEPSHTGRLRRAMELTKTRSVVLGINGALFSEKMLEKIPFAFQPLARAELLTLGMQIGKDVRIKVQFDFANRRRAREGEASARLGLVYLEQLLKQSRQQLKQIVLGNSRRTHSNPVEQMPQAAAALVVLGLLETYKAKLLDLPLQLQGNALVLQVDVPRGPLTTAMTTLGLSAGMLLPLAEQVRRATARLQSQNNLKRIGLAFHNYHDVHQFFPPAAVCDTNGKPLLSWRVAILPYIEAGELYRQFDLSKPWDHPVNKRLIPRMPKIYAHSRAPIEETKSGKTRYRVFVGDRPQTLFGLQRGTRFASVQDGLSNTVMAVEAAEPVTWTKPEPFPFAPDRPLPRMSTLFEDGFHTLFGDVSVRLIPNDINEAVFRGMITTNGGEVVTNDFR